jgi:hypothetical protein
MIAENTRLPTVIFALGVKNKIRERTEWFNEKKQEVKKNKKKLK